MPPPRAFEVVPATDGASVSFVDHIELAYAERYRRRMRFVTAGGLDFLLDLPRATLLRAGDALRLDDGRLIRVDAADESLVEVTATDANALARLAWHIGNRHVPAQIESQRILIRDDPVIVEMLHGLGASTRPVLAGFSPQAGAYRLSDDASDSRFTAHAGPQPHGSHRHGAHTHAEHIDDTGSGEP